MMVEAEAGIRRIWKKGSQTEEFRQAATRSCKTPGNGFPPSASRNNQFCQHLDFSTVELISDLLTSVVIRG